MLLSPLKYKWEPNLIFNKLKICNKLLLLCHNSLSISYGLNYTVQKLYDLI